MTRFFAFGTALVVVALVASRVGAQTEPQPFSVMVYGPLNEMSCGSWTKAQHSATAQEYQLWMLGFVSGQSVWAGRHGIRVTPTDVTAIYTYVDKYCADHPLDPMVKAGNDLVDELVAKSKP